MNSHQHSVLLVEDERKKTVTKLQTLLSSQGYSCEIVSDWQEALQKVKRRNFDLVVCAYRLKGKNGVMLFQEMLSEKPRQVGLIVSNFSDVRVVSDDTRNMDGIGYLVSPCQDAKLLHMVKKMISHGKMRSINETSEKRGDAYNLDDKVYSQSAMNDLDRVYPGITQGAWGGPFNSGMRR
ncbi:MAG: response regulator [Endozoicomonadaceae bacterium]|nr:response regulator [Endozoicomonadaceae bacterium]